MKQQFPPKVTFTSLARLLKISRYTCLLVVLFPFFAIGQNPGELPGYIKPGVLVELYQTEKTYDRVMQLVPGQTPNVAKVLPDIAYWHSWHEGFGGLSDNFILHASGFLIIPTEGTYQFRLTSDDGAKLYISGNAIVDNDGQHESISKNGSIQLTAGVHPFRVEYFQATWWKNLILEWMPPGKTTFSWVPASVFSYQDAVLVTAPGFKQVISDEDVPGYGLPLTAVHPSYDLKTIRQANFQPQVGGMDFLPDGRLVLSTWQEGEVYIVSGVQGEGPYQHKLIGSGLNDPLGLKVVDGVIYVMEKGRLLKLVDTNGDEVTDQYQTVSSGWGTTDNFHEFDFGLVYMDGYFYATLCTAIDFGGSSSSNQHPDRGKVIKINRQNGQYTFVASGLRSPNGIGIGIDNQIFIADNQGDWLPSNKLIHLQADAFYGNRDINPTATATVPETPPALYLPQNQIANSPSQSAPLNDGPYKGQMIFGDVTYGGVTRAYLEKINGVYQGAAFRFTQGLEAGINRLVWGPDGALYVGGIGWVGNWGQPNKLTYGLQRLKYNGKLTFDLLAIRARTDGFELEFTEPIHSSLGNEASQYIVEQWTYQPTTSYGGPAIDKQSITVEAVEVSADRKHVFLRMSTQKKGYVVQFKVNRAVTNATGVPLWNAEGWYTLNQIPVNDPGAVALARASESAQSMVAPAAFEVTSLFPNPSPGNFNLLLDLRQPGTYEVTVKDAKGTTIYTKQTATSQAKTLGLAVNLPNQRNQLYLVQMRHLESGETLTKRVMLH